MEEVHYYRATFARYQAIQDKDPAGIYYITDKGMLFNGNTLIAKIRDVYFGICPTQPGTNAKTCSADPFPVTPNGQPFAGTVVYVKFTNGNTSTSMTLNVNGTNAISVVAPWRQGNGSIPYLAIAAGDSVAFVYDGVNWLMIRDSAKHDTYHFIDNVKVTDIDAAKGYEPLESLSNVADETRVDTGVYAWNGYSEFEIRFKVKERNRKLYLFGSFSGSYARYYLGIGTAHNSLYNICLYTRDNLNILVSDIEQTAGHIYKVRGELRNGQASLYVVDETTGQKDFKSGTYSVDQTNVLVRMFYYSYTSSPAYMNVSVDVFYASFRSNGEDVLEYIPVRRISDSEAGFYNAVGGSFITEYAGNLVPGPALPSGSVHVVSVDVGKKADKVQGAVSGNFAGLDQNGNLTDSGSDASDFATAAQGVLASTAYQKPSTGIPKTDLASDVQTSLDLAGTALQEHQNLPEYSVVKNAVPDTGYFATYRLTVDGEPTGSPINIPNNYIISDVSVKTVTTADVPYQGASVGDKYIDFKINVSGVTQHLYIPLDEIIDPNVFGNTKLFYGTCSSSASATTKTVTCNGFTQSDLVAGVMVLVRFSNTNTGAVASLKLNVESTGAYNIKKNYTTSGISNLTTPSELYSGSVVPFIFTGSVWLAAGLDYNSTYETMSDAEIKAGTYTTGRRISAKSLKDNFDIDESNRTVKMRNSILVVPNDNELIHLTGNETIYGAKTFANETEFQDGVVLSGMSANEEDIIMNSGSMGEDDSYGVLMLESGGGPGVVIRGVESPVSQGDAANKGYVDALNAESVHKSGDDVIYGKKVFTGQRHEGNGGGIVRTSGLEVKNVPIILSRQDSPYAQDDIRIGASPGFDEDGAPAIGFHDADVDYYFDENISSDGAHYTEVRLKNIATPIESHDAATMEYVDNEVYKTNMTNRRGIAGFNGLSVYSPLTAYDITGKLTSLLDYSHGLLFVDLTASHCFQFPLPTLFLNITLNIASGSSYNGSLLWKGDRVLAMGSVSIRSAAEKERLDVNGWGDVGDDVYFLFSPVGSDGTNAVFAMHPMAAPGKEGITPDTVFTRRMILDMEREFGEKIFMSESYDGGLGFLYLGRLSETRSSVNLSPNHPAYWHRGGGVFTDFMYELFRWSSAR